MNQELFRNEIEKLEVLKELISELKQEDLEKIYLKYYPETKTIENDNLSIKKFKIGFKNNTKKFGLIGLLLGATGVCAGLTYVGFLAFMHFYSAPLGFGSALGALFTGSITLGLAGTTLKFGVASLLGTLFSSHLVGKDKINEVEEKNNQLKKILSPINAIVYDQVKRQLKEMLRSPNINVKKIDSKYSKQEINDFEINQQTTNIANIIKNELISVDDKDVINEIGLSKEKANLMKNFKLSYPQYVEIIKTLKETNHNKENLVTYKSFISYIQELSKLSFNKDLDKKDELIAKTLKEQISAIREEIADLDEKESSRFEIINKSVKIN